MALQKTVKKISKFIFVFTIMCLCMTIRMEASAADKVYQLGDNVTGVLSGDGTLTVSGSGPMYDYTSEYESVPNMSPFYEQNTVKKVIIQDGVTSVGKYAFYTSPGIKEVNIAGSVTVIGDHAFCWDSAIRSIVLQEGVEEIGYFSFGHCYKLKNVTLPSSLKKLEQQAFYACYDLQDITTLPEGLEYIGEKTFGGCTLLEELYIPSTVNELYTPIMGRCPSWEGAYALQNVYVSAGNPHYKSVDGVVYSKDGKKLLWYPEGKRDSYYMVPDGVREISIWAFELNEYIEEIHLPDTVTTICHWAFNDATNLQKINLPEGLYSIGQQAFGSCHSLKNLVIPKNVGYINEWAFYDCQNLEDIYIYTTNARISDGGGAAYYYIFYKCPEDLRVHMYEGSTIDTYMNSYTGGVKVYDLDSHPYEDMTDYVGDVNTELQTFSYNSSTNYLSGQIVVVEWRDTNGDGIKESTVPSCAPTMEFVSTDGTESIEVFVTPTGTNTYYFDRLLGGLTPGKEYKFQVTAGNPYNVSAYRSVPVYTGTSGIGTRGNLGAVNGQNIRFKTASDGTLLLYGKDANATYEGHVNSLLTNVQCTKSDLGNFVSGHIIITEWINGVSTVPETTPMMSFESYDGTEKNDVFMLCLDGTNTYYFDRNLSEDMDVNKEYIFRVTLTEPENVSATKSMVVTTNEMASKDGVLWETETQIVKYKTVAADGDNQLRVYAVNK